MTVRLGVLGAGSHSSGCHGPALAAIAGQQPQRVRLVAVCDLDRDKAEAYRQQFGFDHACPDLERLLAYPLDGLLAITPVDLTADLVWRLLPRRIPLLIEKPPGAEPRQTLRMRDCAVQWRTPHMISFNRRFNPAWQQVGQWLQNHRLHDPPPRMISTMQRSNRIESDFITGTGIHLIDIVLSVMGAPHRGALGVKRFSGRRCASFAGELAFGRDRAATIRIEPDADRVTETHELIGPDYRVFVDMMQCAFQARYRDEPLFEWQSPASAMQFDRDGTLNETLAFIELIERNRQGCPDLIGALLTMEVLHAIKNDASFGSTRDAASIPA